MNAGKVPLLPNKAGASEVSLTFLQNVTTKLIVDLYESFPGTRFETQETIMKLTTYYDIFWDKGEKKQLNKANCVSCQLEALY